MDVILCESSSRKLNYIYVGWLGWFNVGLDLPRGYYTIGLRFTTKVDHHKHATRILIQKDERGATLKAPLNGKFRRVNFRVKNRL